MDGEDTAIKRVRYLRLGVLALAILVVAGAALLGWNAYKRYRAQYDAYRALIQPGVTVAGVPVGWLSPEQARAKVMETVAAPYYVDFALLYQDEPVALSPADDLAFDIPVTEMVDEAMAASHKYDYWKGFWGWLKGEGETLDLGIPLRMSHDQEAAARFMAKVAETHNVTATEPMVSTKHLTFIPGKSGRSLDIDTAAQMVNEKVDDPLEREVALPVAIIEPDQSLGRIRSMLDTLGPAMEREPGPPSFYTATIPISTTGGIEGTPRLTYTGELTWTFPYFAAYQGPLTTTKAYFFDPGEPGLTFNVDKATHQVEEALQAGVTAPITFEPDMVAPPPLKPDILIRPLKARLAEFPGVSSILVKNLDTGRVIYDLNTKYVLSGMSIVKLGIMVEVYRHFGGVVDQQTHQELLDMMGEESCNPCANRLMATVGSGSATAGAQRVTATMQQLGLSNFRLCAPFQVVKHWENDNPLRVSYGTLFGHDLIRAGYSPDQQSGSGWGIMPAAAYASTGSAALLRFASATVADKVPGYDRCVKATPAEMAKLLEMVYQCTSDRGTLRTVYPKITPGACQEMIDIMASNNLRNMLGAGIPAEVKLAHKHGFVAASWGDTRAEVGIVFSPGATYLVSFYIWQDIDWINFGIVQPLYRDVSNMLYNFFNPTQPFWPKPQWAPEPEEETGGSDS
jgi:hypothetical protein